MEPKVKTVQIAVTKGGEKTNVKMLYCAAAEGAFERMTGHSTTVFIPTFKTNENGEVVIDKPAAADTLDKLYLALACVVSAYKADGEEEPFTDSYLLYDAPSEDVMTLIRTMFELREAYYTLPDAIVKTTDGKQGKGKRKNA